MNIVITLPQDLWLKIVSGEKSYEMRKWPLPSKFNRKDNVIYVAIKGHNYIAGYFKVNFENWRFDRNCTWHRFGNSLGITKDWFDAYWGKDDYRDDGMFLIGIDNVTVFPPNNRPLLWSFPPQKFRYTLLNQR